MRQVHGGAVPQQVLGARPPRDERPGLGEPLTREPALLDDEPRKASGDDDEPASGLEPSLLDDPALLPRHVLGTATHRVLELGRSRTPARVREILADETKGALSSAGLQAAARLVLEWVSRFNERTEPAGAADRNPNLIGENGQPNAYIDMGLTAVNVAKKYEVSRADMDKYAQRSQELAVQSQENGYFDREIVPVTLEDGSTVAKDDGPRPGSTLEKLAQLDPAFKEDGKVTAGNSCPLNDGAAAVLVMSDAKASELGLRPRARIVTSATAANEPEYMGVAPIGAIGKALDRAGMTIDDMDIVELNEAFAAQVIPIMDECKIPLEKLNTHGGAIALGHPFGMTGARIMTTLLNVMETDDHEVGLETMCVAGGQGKAMIVERLG